MRVLLIEDDENKRKHVAAFVRKEFAAATLVVRKSYQSGLAEALKGQFEVVLLDMSMPTFDVSARERGHEMRPFAGREVLRQLERNDVATRVIVVTQYERFGEGDKRKSLDELRVELKRRFAPLYVATVFYQASSAAWQEKLRKAVSRLVQ